MQKTRDRKEQHTGDVSEAILMPFARIVTWVVAGSTRSGNDGGRSTPASGNSSGVADLDPPVSQLSSPPEEVFATALALAHLIGTLLPVRPWR